MITLLEEAREASCIEQVSVFLKLPNAFFSQRDSSVGWSEVAFSRATKSPMTKNNEKKNSQV